MLAISARLPAPLYAYESCSCLERQTSIGLSGSPGSDSAHPESVVPQDGHDQQDCENAAAKRWLQKHSERYQGLNITALGDNLYCHQPLCELPLARQFSFILSCLPQSHKTLYEHLEGIALPTLGKKQWTGKTQKTYTYRYLNQVPLRDSEDALLVNWCELVITDGKGNILYQNAFATNHLITDQTTEAIVTAGRNRWKVETKITAPSRPKATT